MRSAGPKLSNLDGAFRLGARREEALPQSEALLATAAAGGRVGWRGAAEHLAWVDIDHAVASARPGEGLSYQSVRLGTHAVGVRAEGEVEPTSAKMQPRCSRDVAESLC